MGEFCSGEDKVRGGLLQCLVGHITDQGIRRLLHNGSAFSFFDIAESGRSIGIGTGEQDAY